MNKYLCTVRCSMAAKTESVECLEKEYLQNMDAVTSISVSSNGSVQLLEEQGLKTDSGGNTNEDGWVEIKDPDSSLTEDGDSSRSSNTGVLIERANQGHEIGYFPLLAPPLAASLVTPRMFSLLLSQSTIARSFLLLVTRRLSSGILSVLHLFVYVF